MKKEKIENGNKLLLESLICIAIMFFLVSMTIQPKIYISQALNGITVWALNVLPSLLPFMFFTKILSTLNTIPKMLTPFSILTKKLFNTPAISLYTFIMSILSGYPVGSKMISDLYLQGKITKNEAIRMSAFCSTSGPMFIIGAVGVGMFHSAKIGYILFLSHIIGALLNGILFRKYTTTKTENPTKIPTKENLKNMNKNMKFDLSEIVLNSTLSILNVGCIITIFFIIIQTFSPILNLFPDTVKYTLEGIIEMTKGCIDISQIKNIKLATIISSFIISFGGISTILQSITMLSNLKFKISTFVFQKILHGLLSTLIAFILILIL